LNDKTMLLKTRAAVTALSVLVLLLPFGGTATAAHNGTLQVEPENQARNRGDQVTLTATLSAPPAAAVNIDFENEDGINDISGTGTPPNPPNPPGDTPQVPDRSCTVNAGTLSCQVSFSVANPGEDQWRAWIDEDNQNLTTEADPEEGPDESSDPGSSPGGPAPLAPCGATGPQEPDCTDVVVIETGYLEVIPELQTLDAGATPTLKARLFAPTSDPNGTNIDFENENGANDPDRSSSHTSPDQTCTIPFNQSECSITYPGGSGSDNWRVWVDEDKVQTSVEADLVETRYSGPGDCGEYPDDVSSCSTNTFNEGVGCNDPSPVEEDLQEPDCTDVVNVSFRAGAPARLDCDDRSGAQAQDTERETNASDPEDPEVSSEEYRCRVTDQFGGGINGVQVKVEVESGANDPDNGASYESPDYSCTTFSDPPMPIPIVQGQTAGVCYFTVDQVEGQLGTAEICTFVGSAAEGAVLCAEEPTGEVQTANGEDPGNDLADQVEKTWEDKSALLLNCDPETATNPAGQAHEILCTVTAPSGATVSGVIVDLEITGQGDPPPAGNDPVVPDDECVTGNDGKCTFTHTSTTTGETTYRAWINDEKDEPVAPPSTAGDQDVDMGEGRDETVTPGRAEQDNTDVMSKTWTASPTSVTMTPEADSAAAGECNPFTITVTSANGAPVSGAIIDVEQAHALAANQAANDEPTVGFCLPPESAGPNPKLVDESRGDTGGASNPENPDNRGTAGGETTTDQNGKVTIGINVTPGNGSDGSGDVTVNAWWETTDNDDPAATEPRDTSTKTWTPGEGQPGEPAGVSLNPPSSANEPGQEVTYTATVTDVNGDPVGGTTVDWSEQGEGDFVSQESTTNAQGQARATVTATAEGSQSITVTVEECPAADDPCSDTSQQVWQEAPPPPPPPHCPGHANDSRNQVVGTSGPDRLAGTSGADVICGKGGNDTIAGKGGKDLLLGGGGNDTLNGGGGKDNLKGQKGNDRLRGGSGNDKLSGGPGKDTLNGGGGRDGCSGGPGRDQLLKCE
jgi:Ca2+-binding RTX toxin-like protein